MSGLAELPAALGRTPSLENAVGYIGLDVPVELISAAGFTPVRVVAAPSSTGAAAFAEGMGAPQLRGLAGALIEGPYRELKRLIVSTTPSAYGWLYAFLSALQARGDALSGMEVDLFDLNHGSGASVVHTRRAAVAGLQARLGAGDLAAAIAGQAKMRALMRQVQALREGGAPKITGVEALTAFGAAGAGLDGLISERQAGPVLAGRRTIYSGEETLDVDLYRRLEGAGLIIVADDQDAGTRGIGPDVAMDGDPIAALGEAYAHRDPSPARSSIAARTAYMLGLVGKTQAEHVVFNIAPFDHPPAWELPSLMGALAAAGVTSEVLS